jgi:hypothetical protein
MEAPRNDRLVDNMPHLITLVVTAFTLFFFGKVMHELAAIFPYDLLCLAWFASILMICILITQWNSLRNRSFGFLSVIIGQENVMNLALLVSILFIFLLPFVILYKWLVI